MTPRIVALLVMLTLGLAAPLAAEASDKGGCSMKLELRALAACQHGGPDGWVAHDPSDGLPPPVRAGDRLWFQVGVSDKAHVYLVAVTGAQSFRRVWAAAPVKRLLGKGKRIPFAEGLTLDEATAAAYKYFVVASEGPLDWLEGLTVQDCPQWKDELPPTEPTDLCGRLYGLHGKVPALVRGIHKPAIDFIASPQGRLPAVVQQHTAEGLVAVEFQFAPGR